MSRAQHRRRDSGPFETRPFQEGDDEAWIDWAATAAAGRMMVRVPSQAQHADDAPRGGGPRVDPRLVIVGASALAVTALVAGIVATGGEDGDPPAPPGTTTAAGTTATAPGDGTPPPDGGIAGNLTPNPSFERGTRGWTAWRGILRRQPASPAPDGRFVARVISTRGTAFTLDQRAPESVDGVPAGSVLRGSAQVRAANPQSVGKVVVLRMRQRAPVGRVLAETASRPVRLTQRFAPVTVVSRLAEEGAVLDLRVSGESGWFGTRIVPKDAFDADAVILRVSPD